MSGHYRGPRPAEIARGRSRADAARRRCTIALALPAVLAGALALTGPAQAQLGTVTFSDVAANDGAGISYRRGPGVHEADAEAMYRRTPYTGRMLMMETPVMPRLAGVAVLDYDRDGYPDILATNGPSEKGNPSTGPGVSLYRNAGARAGGVVFEDVSAASGLRARTRGMDAAGVAYADIDNDRCEDVLLTGDNEPNKLFHQTRRGGACTGEFEDVTERSRLGRDSGAHTSASFGDVNGDGLVDLVVAEAWHRRNAQACMDHVADGIGRNRLYLNRGRLRFKDVSASSGIQVNRWFRDSRGRRPDLDGLPTITWATAMVDYDGDGDADVMFADDQCGVRPSRHQSLFPDIELVDRGMLHLFRNDGKGRFTDVSGDVGLDRLGTWMGLSFADFDHNGRLDVFATNLGDYPEAEFHRYPYSVGELASRAFMGQPDGTFADPGPGERVRTTTFGWGTGALDYDNDGCTDIVYHGGVDMMAGVDRSNPGTLLHNLCGPEAGQFEMDQASYAPTPERIHAMTNGLATGDFDRNGTTDLVSVAPERMPDSVPPTKFTPLGGPSDATAFYWVRLMPTDPKRPLWKFDQDDYEQPDDWRYMGWSPEPGRLAVDVNSGNANRWVKVVTAGGKGLVKSARVNRDGIGAVVRVTPAAGRPSMVPVLGGSSFLSQHDRMLGFGLGRAESATVEVRWPGGTRNRLYDVRAGETVVFPEIPCRFDRRLRDRRAYSRCVRYALRSAASAGLIEQAVRRRFHASALRAYDDARNR